MPISSISGWYDYFRGNGAPLSPETPGELSAEVEDQSTADACSS